MACADGAPSGTSAVAATAAATSVLALSNMSPPLRTGVRVRVVVDVGDGEDVAAADRPRVDADHLGQGRHRAPEPVRDGRDRLAVAHDAAGELDVQGTARRGLTRYEDLLVPLLYAADGPDLAGPGRDGGVG